MPGQKTQDSTSFGARLAQLRKAAGFAQEELAAEIWISRRIIAYYESETDYPPTALLPKIAQALRISADELLGIAPVKKATKPGNSRLQRRLQQIEQLDAAEKRQALQVIDALIERGQLKRKAG